MYTYKTMVNTYYKVPKSIPTLCKDIGRNIGFYRACKIEVRNVP